ncbi:DNA cytosine methyltransferase [Saccharothrix sp. ST-888]|uniref:DNA cytosine methyltransferase n=1 Tax=Saccharothrix sp. ST-888 TaxID=1427391 RepID=UPI0005EC0D60|nr:DNA (cytosine-5-)-methyltransferase [Saccharothrix sp. ST-888]
MGASRRSQQTAPKLTSIEICAGAGGQAVGLHKAGFAHRALVELDPHAVKTLRANVHPRLGWPQEQAQGLQPMNVLDFRSSSLLKDLRLKPGELDLLAGGVPCPPFSLAGKQLGPDDERDLFPEMLEIVDLLRPKAVMIENVRGILEPPHVFIDYRREILEKLRSLDYVVPEIKSSWSVLEQDVAMRKVWRRLDARDFGVPQLRPRAILVAIHKDHLNGNEFIWPRRLKGELVSVVEKLEGSMRERYEPFWDLNKWGQSPKPDEFTGRQRFERWLEQAEKARSGSTEGVAPTLVGGSKKHGGADLGPTRAKQAWKEMGVDAMGVANDPAVCDAPRDLFRENGPMLTVGQAAILQGFPEEWKFEGGKTARYRQVGNAFPPPVAEAVGRAIAAVLRPKGREELLAKYELDGAADHLAESSSEQMEIFAPSVLAATRPARKNNVGDLARA